MTPEGRVKATVKEVLKAHGAYWHCPVQNGFGAPSLDFIICFKGKYAGIETKKPGGKPTLRQEITISEIRKAGGKVFVIDGDCAELEAWLKKNIDVQDAGSVR